MIVRYIKNKEIEKAGYQFTQIVAEKSDGTPYTKDFFANDEFLGGKLAEFDAGDFLLLTYDTTKYKNLADIQPAEGFAPEYKGGSGSNGSKQTTSSGGGGNSRGEDTNRASAIYLAKEVVEKDIDLSKIISIADKVNLYISTGVNPLAKDGLEVPDVKGDK